MLKFTCAWAEVKIDLINRTEAFKAHAKEEVIYGISYGEQSHCTLLATVARASWIRKTKRLCNMFVLY